MTADADPPFPGIQARSHWVRLRTLVVLRWFAIIGQLFALTLAQRWYQLDVNLGLCFLAIGAGVTANLIAVFIYPENKRLSEPEVGSILLFDISQLIFLLYLTGGLNNPFALLVLAPVTISATALNPRTTIPLGLVTIALVTVLAFWHQPLVTRGGVVMEMPEDFVLGFWVAIVIGVVFLSAYAQRVTAELHAMSEALTATQMALAREQKLTDLGGVIAAAAHELGTPLATMKLVSTELKDELADRPDLLEDVNLIAEQADRCRDILHSMGRAGKDDRHLHHVPISELVREAAEPHAHRGKTLHYDIAAREGADATQPEVSRRPEIIHGLRNLIQNAVDFASGHVWIDVQWDDATILVRIIDDGRGISSTVMGRLGDPFVSRRRQQRGRRGYEGMGLGLFIAKTLLERTGAELSFANGREPYEERAALGERRGAVVEARWPRDMLEVAGHGRAPLGKNLPLEERPFF